MKVEVGGSWAAKRPIRGLAYFLILRLFLVFGPKRSSQENTHDGTVSLFRTGQKLQSPIFCSSAKMIHIKYTRTQRQRLHQVQSSFILIQGL